MTRVLALDPGDRVGWARADVDQAGTWTNLRHGITPLRDMALALASDDYAPEYDVVVIENWTLHADKAKTFIGSSFPSVQFIGMVKLCCWLSGTTLVIQQPANKTPADKSMARLRPELYEKVTTPRRHDDAHDMDALRHLWFWTFKNCDVPIPQEVQA